MQGISVMKQTSHIFVQVAALLVVASVLTACDDGVAPSSNKPAAAKDQSTLQSAQDVAAWEAAQTADTLEAYRQYLIEFPRGQSVAAAKQSIAKLAANTWDIARQSNDPSQLAAFVAAYPDCRFAP
jgi:hypothetical protein